MKFTKYKVRNISWYCKAFYVIAQWNSLKVLLVAFSKEICIEIGFLLLWIDALARDCERLVCVSQGSGAGLNYIACSSMLCIICKLLLSINEVCIS